MTVTSGAVPEGNNANAFAYSFETSASIIKKAREIDGEWQKLGKKDAISFIRTPPQRDSRSLMDRNRFRLLLVQEPEKDRLYAKNKDILETAKEHHWINDQSMYFLDSRTGWVSASRSADGVYFSMQIVKDSSCRIYSLFLAEQRFRGRRDSDWVCLVFSDDGNPDAVKELFKKEPFPSDFDPPLSPDFMVLPTSLLCLQVDEIKTRLYSIQTKVEELGGMQIPKRAEELYKLRQDIFTMRQTYLQLKGQGTLAQEIAKQLQCCFDILEKASSTEMFEAVYSKTLRNRVQSSAEKISVFLQELNGIPQRIDAQQIMFDSQTGIILALNSERLSKQALRDGNSMRTIAMLTLIFLPGTFVAAIFSMSMFDWQNAKDQGGKITSWWLWLYFVVTIVLTVIVIMAWYVWFKHSDRKYAEESEAAWVHEKTV